jgi:5-methylcytosine-specific restriction endonuclease McrA
MYKRTPITSWDCIDTIFGDVFYNLNGQRIKRGEPFDPAAPLPVVLDNHKMLYGDLIPGTSWGSSLSNLLTKSSWDKMRHPLIARHNNICEICGKRYETLDVHEIWDYKDPTPEEIEASNEKTRQEKEAYYPIGIQRLAGLVAICKSCHLCFHLGFARVQDRYDETIDRLRDVNGWTQAEVEQYAHELEYRFKRRSEFLWAMDLSFCQDHPDGGITIKGEWVRKDDNVPYLVSEDKKTGDERATWILNTAWKFARAPEFVAPTSLNEFEKAMSE